MATPADTQPKLVIHPTSSPAKADKQTSEGRDSPHPTDTPVIRREAVIRAASAQSGSSTPRGQSPLTLVSATAGSGSRTASPITHLEEARGERCVHVCLFHCLPLCICLAIAVTYVPCLLVHPSANLLEDKYTELMTVVAEMAREVKPAYTGNKGSAEKLKKSELFMLSRCSLWNWFDHMWLHTMKFSLSHHERACWV